MTEDIKVLEPYTVDPSNTISVTRALAEGATCTFYGCYSTRDSNRHSASFALQPTSCVIGALTVASLPGPPVLFGEAALPLCNRIMRGPGNEAT